MISFIKILCDKDTVKTNILIQDFIYILQIFEIVREGESTRYSPFKQLHNKQLLWHGSRITNYAGILSQGLRIAPPEAPVVSSCI